MTLSSIIGKYDRKLKKYYKEQMEYEVTEPAAVWICDNYHICSAGLTAAKSFVSHNGEKGLLPLFLSCKKLAENTVQVTASGIINAFSDKKLSVFQSEALKPLLFSAFAAECCDRAINGELTEAAVRNLIGLREIDFSYIRERVCMAEKYLLDDPTGEYGKCDEKTKKLYRDAVMRGAKKEKKDETAFIKERLNAAQNDKNGKNHIGFYLDIMPSDKKAGILFIASEWVLSFVISLLLSFLFADSIIIGFFILFPVYAVIKAVGDMVFPRLFPAFSLPSLKEEEISSADTVIAVSCVMPPQEKAEEMYEHLASVFSADASENVKVMLLADLRNSPEPEDFSDKAEISAMKRLTDRLNSEFGGGFSFAVRDRVFSPTENCYTGFERKRGAIMSLAKYLRDKNSGGFSLVYGDTENLQSMKYILALDSDTSLSFEGVRQLVAAASHPLNIPVRDAALGRVVSGYGIINPVTETSIESSEKTFFSSVFTFGGTGAYSSAVNERYSDMFGEGIFTGKGLIHIDSFIETVCDKFDNERILSHDILEGAVMRTAFYSQVRFTDCFPSSVKKYFLRLHRWIRGDVQNLRYIIRPLSMNGASPSMPCLAKYQLFDNLRRAITPVLSFIIMTAACFADSTEEACLYFFVSLLSIVSPELLSIIFSFIKRGPEVFSSLYFSEDISGVYKALCRIVINCGSICESACFHFDAVFRALYRSFISKKNLLQWTAAADATANAGSTALFSVILPVFTSLLFYVKGLYCHRLIALLILIFIPFSLSGGIKNRKRKEALPSENEKRILQSFAAGMWSFFEENVTPFENFLPPDNIQETPVPKRAKRTSPTNIGFYLVSCLAAADLLFIDTKELYRRIDETLHSIEIMPKYNGLLYNWYDTVRLKPLHPAFVSSVDCGNFLVCLTALKEGLKEYAAGEKDFYSLIKRIESVLEASDLSPLYDKSRELFRIGIDCESGKLSSSCYDLYMSEARMMSYYECAKRHVPSSHWAKLGRPLRRSGPYVTAVSWTGTLFEYFMPVLFMSVIPGSFQYEALKSGLFLQKKFAAREKIPYGISESCFYALDSDMSYRYKAHGLKKLALKREADEEKVVSPYSVFLTLPFDRKSAMKALAEFSRLYAQGKYGFYESVDFTRSRQDGSDYSIVRSYMSHHVGMSLVAVCNTLRDNIFVKRFMSDREMKSARALLEEKLPAHPPVSRFVQNNHDFRNKNKKSGRGNINAEGSRVFAWSGGAVTLFADLNGNNRCVFGGKEMYKYTSVSRGISVGVSVDDGSIIPLFPLYDNDVQLTSSGMVSSAAADETGIKSAVMVHPYENALLIPVKLENESDEEVNADICVFCEPDFLNLLTKDRHPAFSDMFLRAEYDKKSEAAVFYRLNEDHAPSFAAGFSSKESFSYCFDRERIIKRQKDAKSVFDRGYDKNASAERGINPVCALKTSLVLKPGENKETVLVLAFGSDKHSALRTLSSVRSHALPSLTKGETAEFLRDGMLFNFAENFISSAFFSGSLSPLVNEAAASFSSSYEALWKCGISGDIPLFTVFPDAGASETLLRAFVRFHKRLSEASVITDAVFVFEGNKDYGCTGLRKLMAVIKEEGQSDFIDRHGGIHILYRGNLDRDSFEAAVAFSSACYPDNGFRSSPERHFVPRLSAVMPLSDKDNYFSEQGFVINRHPDIPWSHTLSDKCFGTLVTDISPGFTWAYNSSLNKLTPWSNNTATDLTGERLFMELNGRKYDITDNATVVFSDTCALYLCKADELVIKTKIFIPVGGMKKCIEITLENTGDKKADVRLFFCAFPLLGERENDGRFLKINTEKNRVSVKNCLNTDFGGVLILGCENDNACGCDSTEKFFGWHKKCAGILQKIAIHGKASEKTVFYLQFSRDDESAKRLMNVPLCKKDDVRYSFSTPYSRLNEFASALLYHQVKDTRINARCGFYQCSGAYGFRDQLQDACALIGRDNRLVKQLIYKAASAQFPEGDVLHWFHVIYRKGLIYKGVRTRCSDDMLWLVQAVSKYVLETGDKGILDKKIPFAKGEILKEGENERYGEYRLSDKNATLFVHCLAALNRSFTKGAHSLPLIGNGDWNDSFSLVGREGSGESVWLAMFIRKTASDFAKICDMRKEHELSAHLKRVAEEYTAAAEKYAWNGRWYLRGFYDNSDTLGDEGNECCEIDLLTQAWSVLSDMPDKSRRRQALKSACEKLFDEENGVVKLFSPPFNEKSRPTGYVNRYPEGMRENGGQYTHAAVWFCTALFTEGMRAEGEKVLSALLPNEKYKNGCGEYYKTEPYALCGDVYSAEGHEGRGGWSLYTGSAGWFIQLADYLEDM